MNDKLNKIVEELKTLTLLEAAELVKEIEEVFGVDTSVSVGAVAMAAPVAAADAGGGDEQPAWFSADCIMISNIYNGDINITSPTGLKTYFDLTGINLAKVFWKGLKA